MTIGNVGDDEREGAACGWGDNLGILTHFSDQLFAGLVIRELARQALATYNLATPLDSSIIKGIIGERHHKSTGYLAELRLMLDLDPSLLTSALQAINGTRDPGQGAEAAVAAWITTTLPKVRVWDPKSMVEHVYPDIVLDYVCAQTSKQIRKKTTKTTQQRKINVQSPGTGGSSNSVTTANQEGHATVVYVLPNKQQGLSSGKTTDFLALPERQYTAMSVAYQGQEVLELITDSEGEY
ncbi:hypothetical protein B0H13DRAFT_2496495 [Mycena leptocephala]|nr:hypothetical protein B0H13DRAFT_2496495 [Mycena leptocephala]